MNFGKLAVHTHVVSTGRVREHRLAQVLPTVEHEPDPPFHHPPAFPQCTRTHGHDDIRSPGLRTQVPP